MDKKNHGDRKTPLTWWNESTSPNETVNKMNGFVKLFVTLMIWTANEIEMSLKTWNPDHVDAA